MSGHQRVRGARQARTPAPHEAAPRLGHRHLERHEDDDGLIVADAVPLAHRRAVHQGKLIEHRGAADGAARGAVDVRQRGETLGHDAPVQLPRVLARIQRRVHDAIGLGRARDVIEDVVHRVEADAGRAQTGHLRLAARRFEHGVQRRRDDGVGALRA